MYITNYKVKGKHNETNRMRTVEIKAISIEDCKNIAFDKGLIEPLEIIELPPSQPTQRQIEYAQSLEIEIPDQASLEDVSALISRKTDGDYYNPNQELIDYANGRNMIFSKYIGKNALYQLIFNTLTGIDKIEFFIFCVYRWLSDDRHGNLDTHQHKDKFRQISELLFTDSTFIKSVERYDGSQIRFFGEIVTADGYVSNGGSQNTIAYKKALEILCREFNLKNRLKKEFKYDIHNTNNKNTKAQELHTIIDSYNKIKSRSSLKTLLHVLLSIFTGGVWPVVLLVIHFKNKK